jgi:hypothetical protein
MVLQDTVTRIEDWDPQRISLRPALDSREEHYRARTAPVPHDRSWTGHMPRTAAHTRPDLGAPPLFYCRAGPTGSGERGGGATGTLPYHCQAGSG